MRALVAIACLTLVPSIAAAQDARALLDEGISLREEGRDADALARFERAYEAEASPEALAQIALAEQALGRFASAEAHLQAALTGEPDRFVRRYHELLEQALSEIRARLGTLTLTGAEGATVTVAGEARGQLPLAEPLRVTAGTVHVEAELEGHRPFARDVEVPAEGEATLAIDLERIPAPEPEPLDPEPTPVADAGWPWTMTAGVITAGTGVVALAIAAGLMAAREDHAQARLSCSDADPACRDHFYAAVDFETASVAMFVAGGVLLAGGATLLTIGLTTPSEQPRVACLPAGLGVTCAGTF